ncbi:MAG: ATP-binding protein [Clostridia bacterium]
MDNILGNLSTATSEECKAIERSLITTYRRRIWAKFVAAIKEYRLIQDGDKIAVCISGGKDSMLLAKCMQELKAHGKDNFEVVYLVMDAGYNSANREMIEKNAALLNLPIEIFETDIFNIAASAENNPCYLCARMRRGYLYKNAKRLGCNKIALGHHFDDVVETVMLGMLYNGRIRTMMPKLQSKNYEGMELIRPLYHVREKDIIAWKNYNKLEFLQCACRFTESGREEDSKRLEMKNLIKRLEGEHKGAAANIFRSMYNIDLSTIISYKKQGKEIHFLDDYDKE